VLGDGRPRSVQLTGTRRLSTSVAIGGVLSAVSGFRIEMSYRGEILRTDANPGVGTPGYNWREDFCPNAYAAIMVAARDTVLRRLKDEHAKRGPDPDLPAAPPLRPRCAPAARS
jgi:hypothetical protein